MKPFRPILSALARARPVWRRVAVWMMVLPFLFFATLSQGTMLEHRAGGVRIVLCTGEGMVEAVMSADGTVHPVEEGGAGDHADLASCAWALHGQHALADAGPLPVAPVMLALRAAYDPEAPGHLRRIEVLAPSARGPPAFV